MSLYERFKDSRAYIRMKEWFETPFSTIDMTAPASRRSRKKPEHTFWQIWSKAGPKGEKLGIGKRILRGFQSGRHAANRMMEIPNRLRSLFPEKEEGRPVMDIGATFDAMRERADAEAKWHARARVQEPPRAASTARQGPEVSEPSTAITPARQAELRDIGRKAAFRMASEGRQLSGSPKAIAGPPRAVPPPPKGLPGPKDDGRGGNDKGDSGRGGGHER